MSLITSAYIKEACFLPPEQSKEATCTLRLWKRYFKHAISSKTLDKKSECICSDFNLVLRLIQHDMVKIQSEAKRHLLVVKDNTSQIQALLSLRIEETAGKIPRIYICHLLTAPWNLRLNVEIYNKPIYGAGVVAFVAALIFAKKIGAHEVALSSTPSGSGFYEKIGMKRTLICHYSLKVDKASTEKLKAAFLKIVEKTEEAGGKLELKT
jgi:hypothetical protein